RRIKHIAGFPAEAIRACLAMAGVSAHEVDHVAVSRNPRANIVKKAMFAARHRPMAMVKDRAAHYRQVGAIPETVASALGLGPNDKRPEVHWVEHHPAHLASAFYVSPFDEAAVGAVDGFGDFVSTSWAVGRGARLNVIHRTFFPHS